MWEERERERKKERKRNAFHMEIIPCTFRFFHSSPKFSMSRRAISGNRFEGNVSTLSLSLFDEKVWLLNFQRHYLCRESQVAFMNYSCESWSKIVKTDTFFSRKIYPLLDRVTTFSSFVPSCNLTTIGIEIFLINVLDTRANESRVYMCVYICI